MTIRKLNPGDPMTEMTQLVRSSYQQLADMGFRYWGTHQNEEDTRYRCSQGTCLVVEDSGQLVGTVVLKEDQDDDAPDWYRRDGVMIVTQFAVLPKLQGRGLGGRLMDECESRAFDDGASEIALDTSEGALHLIDFYTKRGYRHVGRHDYNGTNYVSVVMSKRIRSTLTTERLVLRELQESDRPVIKAYWEDESFLSCYPPDRLSQEHCDETIDAALVELASYPRRKFSWAITVSGKTVGRIRLDLSSRNSGGDIGYELSPSHWGKGFATEALREVVRYAFEELKLHRLNCWCYSRNEASRHVLEKAGFVYEGAMRQRCSWGDEWVDDLIFGLLAEDWLLLYNNTSRLH